MDRVLNALVSFGRRSAGRQLAKSWSSRSMPCSSSTKMPALCVDCGSAFSSLGAMARTLFTRTVGGFPNRNGVSECRLVDGIEDAPAALLFPKTVVAMVVPAALTVILGAAFEVQKAKRETASARDASRRLVAVVIFTVFNTTHQPHRPSAPQLWIRATIGHSAHPRSGT